MQMARVSTSKHYDVSGRRMWERMGDPRRISEWHPFLEVTEVLDGGKRRINTRGDGGRVSETILEQAERHYSYQIDESQLPFDDLVGTIRVRDEDEDTCVVEWEATFDPAGIPENEAVELVRGFFQAGLDALQSVKTPRG
jgi:mxaD protein